jgi:hypothetical protein
MQYIASRKIIISSIKDILTFNPQFPRIAIYWMTGEEGIRMVLIIFWLVGLLLICLPSKMIKNYYWIQLTIFNGQLLFFSYLLLSWLYDKFHYLKGNPRFSTSYYYTPFYWIVWSLSLLFLILWLKSWQEIYSSSDHDLSDSYKNESLYDQIKWYVYSSLFGLPVIMLNFEIASFTYSQVSGINLETEKWLEINSIVFVVSLILAITLYMRYLFLKRHVVINLFVSHIFLSYYLFIGWISLLELRSNYSGDLDNSDEVDLTSLIIAMTIAYIPITIQKLKLELGKIPMIIQKLKLIVGKENEEISKRVFKRDQKKEDGVFQKSEN